MVIRQLIAYTLAALACTVPVNAAEAEAPERWYDRSRVESGGKVYVENCAVCHGARGERHPTGGGASPTGRSPRRR